MTEGTLAIGSTPPVWAVSFAARRWPHEVVLLPPAASGQLTVRTASVGAQARRWVLLDVA